MTSTQDATQRDQHPRPQDDPRAAVTSPAHMTGERPGLRPEALAELFRDQGDGPAGTPAWMRDAGWVEDFREWMHAHPELSGHEEQTAAAIEQRLRAFDCEVSTGIGGHGITAVWRHGDGPSVLMRADFDALPVQETTGLPYASTVPGVMHACGHDVHTAALLGVCAYLDSHPDAWSGTFTALFQPAEETTVGARAMVDDGLAERIPTPEICLGQHIVPGPVGRVYSAPGPVLAACDTITITLHGRSAHGSAPHESVDPTYLAALIVVRLQGIVGREVAPSDFAVITVGTLSAGHTNNTIPDSATLVLNCRFYDTGVREKVYAAIERVVRGECIASGCPQEPEIVFSAHGELTDNSPEVFERVRPYFDAVFEAESVDAERWTASEDFSEIPRHFGVPYLFWTVGVTDRELLARVDAHNEQEAATEDADAAPTVPGNHSSDFAPAPGSVSACVRAGLCAVLAYLGRER